MKLLKLAQNISSIRGVTIKKRGDVGVRYANFSNLTAAYEYMLNKLPENKEIRTNPVRPKLLARLLGTPPAEAYAIIKALADTENFDGDVCEFGVAQGETSALIGNEILGEARNFHLFDSFQGLPKPSEKDGLKDDIFSLGSMAAYQGKMSCPEDMVRARLRAVSFPTDRYFIHKGFIEDIINVDKNLPTKVSFAYVDFDFYEPIKIALEYLHGVLLRGGVAIVDDYDFFSTGAKTAVQEFLAEKDPDGRTYDIHVPDKQLGYFAVLTKKA